MNFQDGNFADFTWGWEYLTWLVDFEHWELFVYIFEC